MKRIVYIASPYTVGYVAVNVRESLIMADRLEGLGFMVFAPLLSHFRHMIRPHEYEYWVERDIEWLERCDCVLRMPGKSEGADREVGFAQASGKPVYWSIEELCRVEGNEH